MSHHNEQIEGHEVTLSNLDKVLYPDDGITKGDVIDYYRRVADVLLPHLADRPLNLHRSPDGIDRTGFFQQHADPHTPDWVTTADIPARGDKSPVRHLVCQDEATLGYLANLAALELHRWLSRRAVRAGPGGDRPGSAGRHPAADLRHAAMAIRMTFENVGLVPFVQTTGGRGYHVVAPLDATVDDDRVRLTSRPPRRARGDAHRVGRAAQNHT